MTERKDRLVQTRVAEKLETTLKDEARRRRTTVSQIIRNILEDTFNLVDGVVANVDQIVSDSVELAQTVGRDARRFGKTRQGAARDSGAPCLDPRPDAEAVLAGNQAWNEVVLNRPVPCSRCGAELARGRKAYMGLSEDPTLPRAWLCAPAVDALAPDVGKEEE